MKTVDEVTVALITQGSAKDGVDVLESVCLLVAERITVGDCFQSEALVEIGLPKG